MDDAYFVINKPKTRQIMLILEQKDGQSAREIVNQVGCKTSTFYRLKDLVGYGFLKRRVLEDVYRTPIYHLTPKGRKWCRVLNWLTEQKRQGQ